MTLPARYGSLSIGLHRLMLLLIALIYVAMEFRDIFPKGIEGHSALKPWHYILGLSKFALVWILLPVNLVATAPRVTPALPRWQTEASKCVHAAAALLHHYLAQHVTFRRLRDMHATVAIPKHNFNNYYFHSSLRPYSLDCRPMIY